MCSDPQEFINKLTGEAVIVGCRVCDECIATRRHGWVARAMAEKTDWPHTVCLALTYSDETPEGRDGAAMFCYAHVSDFLKRLRSAAAREAKRAKWNVKPVIRFLCAGEQGDRNGRCHWHMIIYSNFDLTCLGKFHLRGNLVSDRRDMITEGKRKRRLNWTLWPFGFMTLQEPDQGGMNYVLSYCLKDQFTQEKSEGTMREAKSENFATGLFRMSKRPAIGENYLMRKMEELDAKGAVLPALKIKIPDFHGYWQPNGSFRKKLLWCLVALNQRALWATGANAPQWSSLLSSCVDNESDLEILNGTQQKQDPDYVSPDGWKNDVEHVEQRRKEAAYFARNRSIGERNSRCRRAVPCHQCLDGFGAEKLETIGVTRTVNENGSNTYRAAGYIGTEARDVYDGWRNTRLRHVNPDCQGAAGLKAQTRAFPRSSETPT